VTSAFHVNQLPTDPFTACSSFRPLLSRALKCPGGASLRLAGERSGELPSQLLLPVTLLQSLSHNETRIMHLSGVPRYFSVRHTRGGPDLRAPFIKQRFVLGELERDDVSNFLRVAPFLRPACDAHVASSSAFHRTCLLRALSPRASLGPALNP
jgi:hypothetical protein